jgi:DNA helicase HerA-like ATPase
MIVRLHGYVLRGDQPRELRRVLVFDEAWRVKDSERLQELAREGRAFGVGIAIGTQFPGDIQENLAGNLATQVFLHNKEADHQKAIARALAGTTSGPKAAHIIQTVARLQKHEGFVRNQQHTPYILVRTTPHYERKHK